MEADWKKYELILFHFIQNSVKYNNYLGSIIIDMQIQNLSVSNNQRMLVTKIIDTGIGISKQR
jgi:signal transduction histidine kinase